jgi:hypothetical protein
MNLCEIGPEPELPRLTRKIVETARGAGGPLHPRHRKCRSAETRGRDWKSAEAARAACWPMPAGSALRRTNPLPVRVLSSSPIDCSRSTPIAHWPRCVVLAEGPALLEKISQEIVVAKASSCRPGPRRAAFNASQRRGSTHRAGN